jgi:putative endonuclease
MVNRSGRGPSRNRRKGNLAESEAAAFLERKGHRILERNFRAERGEIDIITMQEGILVFVEVKSGTAGGPVDPEDKVNPRKQRQIGKTASAYLLKTGADPSGCRFDVVSVVRGRDRTEIRHIEDAFWLES